MNEIIRAVEQAIEDGEIEDFRIVIYDFSYDIESLDFGHLEEKSRESRFRDDLIVYEELFPSLEQAMKGRNEAVDLLGGYDRKDKVFIWVLFVEITERLKGNSRLRIEYEYKRGFSICGSPAAASIIKRKNTTKEQQRRLKQLNRNAHKK